MIESSLMIAENPEGIAAVMKSSVHEPVERFWLLSLIAKKDLEKCLKVMEILGGENG